MYDSDIKVSYSILTHNEEETLQNLLNRIYENKSIWDEIVIVDDNSTSEKTLDILSEANKRDDVYVHTHSLDANFSAQKNFANSKCRNEYIFNIDADEMLSVGLIQNIKPLIDINREIEVFRVPRINTVSGITLEHVQHWRWHISKLEEYTETKLKSEISDAELKLLEHFKFIIDDSTQEIKYYIPIINWPDFQYRLYKRNDSIEWYKKLHEFLRGYKTFAHFPAHAEYAILHPKTIQKQEQQNQFYSKIWTDAKGKIE